MPVGGVVLGNNFENFQVPSSRQGSFVSSAPAVRACSETDPRGIAGQAREGMNSARPAAATKARRMAFRPTKLAHGAPVLTVCSTGSHRSGREPGRGAPRSCDDAVPHARVPRPHYTRSGGQMQTKKDPSRGSVRARRYPSRHRSQLPKQRATRTSPVGKRFRVFPPSLWVAGEREATGLSGRLRFCRHGRTNE